MLHRFGNYKVFFILYVWAKKILNNPEGGTSTACCQNISQTHKYCIMSESIGVFIAGECEKGLHANLISNQQRSSSGFCCVSISICTCMSVYLCVFGCVSHEF